MSLQSQGIEQESPSVLYELMLQPTSRFPVQGYLFHSAKPLNGHFLQNCVFCKEMTRFLPAALRDGCSSHPIWTPCFLPRSKEEAHRCQSHTRKTPGVLAIGKDGLDVSTGSESLRFTSCWEGRNSFCTCWFLVLSPSILCWPLTEIGCWAGGTLALNSCYAVKIWWLWRVEGFFSLVH